MSTFLLRLGDSLPPFHATLLGPLHTPLPSADFPAGVSAELVLRRRTTPVGTEIAYEATLITSGSAVEVQHNWDPTDLLPAGRYELWVRLTFASGDVQSFPNGEPDELLITP